MIIIFTAAQRGQGEDEWPLHPSNRSDQIEGLGRCIWARQRYRTISPKIFSLPPKVFDSKVSWAWDNFCVPTLWGFFFNEPAYLPQQSCTLLLPTWSSGKECCSLIRRGVKAPVSFVCLPPQTAGQQEKVTTLPSPKSTLLVYQISSPAAVSGIHLEKQIFCCHYLKYSFSFISRDAKLSLLKAHSVISWHDAGNIRTK